MAVTPLSDAQQAVITALVRAGRLELVSPDQSPTKWTVQTDKSQTTGSTCNAVVALGVVKQI